MRSLVNRRMCSVAVHKYHGHELLGSSFYNGDYIQGKFYIIQNVKV